MADIFFSSYKVEDRSYVSFVKREIHNLIAKSGFSSMRAGELDIVVSELLSNVIKHAGGGEVFYRISNEENNNKVFEIYCIDNGPGNNNIAKMMKDGESSSNTLGHGLGAINRLSDFFQIYSTTHWGTVAYAKIFMNEPPKKTIAPKNSIHIDALQVCMPGEEVCGDGYCIKKTNDETQLFLGDGLGHGPNAHEAVSAAIDAFKECSEIEPEDILRFIHQKVRKTRGLVANIASYHHQKKQWKTCGVGNISTRFYEGLSVRKVLSHNGIIGLNIPAFMNTQILADTDYQHIFMFSDGIRGHWDLHQFPSILKYASPIMAGAIFKDYSRGNDDMTLLVGKVN
ncbi:ATP-binding protein [Emticicia sp. BO119]|uniref:ATP-binding protein n=1 Tax=Emticicia sp. BO119 TaxID=2757768 RepID=UPI0015F0627F|nr:ATP-binding protein [Emticicia sp. BO119]MBA4853822.1 ATP-binding protein [Emticicia sp. BO119]